MKASIDKRLFEHTSYLRLGLPKKIEESILDKIFIYLKIKNFKIHDEYLLFEYVEDNIIEILEHIKKTLVRFNIDIEISNSIQEEIFNYQNELENFKRFSKNAKSIRNNQFENIEELSQKFNEFKSVISKSLTRKLYDLQFLSAFHMSYSVNSLNFSVPGAGKTSIVYAAYSFLKHTNLVDKLFVVGPLSSFQAWEKEYESCFNKKVSSYRYSGVDGVAKEDKKAHLYSENPCELNLIYYQGAENLSDDLIAFMKKNKVMLVVDEAHRIKNTDGKWGKIITKISQSAKSRVALTGTPIPNGYEDIYNIFKFIYPFKFKSILNFHYSQLQDLSKNPHNESEINYLIENISPFFMRIRKEDLPNLPKINEKETFLKMDRIQDEIYCYVTSLAESLQNATSSSYETDFLIRAMLIRLRQAATNPYLLSMSLEKSIEYDEDFNPSMSLPEKLNAIDDEIFDFNFRQKVGLYYQQEVPSKIKYCIKRIKEILDNNFESKIIIWTIFTENTRYLKEELNKININSSLLIGSVETKDREVIVESFNAKNSNLRVVIANPFTVGESVSLHHSCNYAIYLERDYNCSNFIQSKDRIHRVGSNYEDVYYEYISSKGTIDEAISRSLTKKVSRMSELIDNEIPFFKLLEEENEESKLIREALEIYKNLN